MDPRSRSPQTQGRIVLAAKVFVGLFIVVMFFMVGLGAVITRLVECQ